MPPRAMTTGNFGSRRERWRERPLASDEVRGPAPSGQRHRLVVKGGTPRVVAGLRFGGEGLEERLDGLPVSGAAGAADAAWAKGEPEGAVDLLQHAREILLPLHDHDAADARRPLRHPLGDAAELHAAIPPADADAVVAGAELVPDLPHLRRESQAGERAERKRRRLVVALGDAAPELLSRRADDGEAEGARVGGGRAPAGGPDEDGVALVVR